MSNINRQSGITLIEVLITLLVTTVGLLGLAALQLSALQATADSSQRSQAVWLMQDLIERMRANPQATDANYRQAVACTTAAKRCAALPNNPVAEVCSATEMAYFDLWEAQCTRGAANQVYSSRDSLLPAGDGQNIISLSDSGTMEATAAWFYKGASSHASSGITVAQEVVR